MGVKVAWPQESQMRVWVHIIFFFFLSFWNDDDADKEGKGLG